jgi:hypothetical protein
MDPQTERDWNQMAYQWARYLRISWYHAVADLDDLRRMHGDRGAADHVRTILSTANY